MQLPGKPAQNQSSLLAGIKLRLLSGMVRSSQPGTASWRGLTRITQQRARNLETVSALSTATWSEFNQTNRA
jgi:hypothetical protein